MEWRATEALVMGLCPPGFGWGCKRLAPVLKTRHMSIAFAKYEGLGNDFVIVDGRTQSTKVALAAEHARQICDRHRGVGADGVLLIEYTTNLTDDSVRPFMRVINADGSRPEMCGNGIRCVALHLVRNGMQPVGVAFEIDTDAGPHSCLVASRERESAVEVSMRAADLDPAAVPVVAKQPVVNELFELAGASLRLTCVSMGNPHAVTFDVLDANGRARLGPQLEKHARFPQAANIGFARMLGPQVIELGVWERGVGFTEACGTGACACAVAAVETKRAERHRPIEVRLPGGVLQILVREPAERISMTGLARHVFDGSIEG
jgi:diaminopimelate epimerase